MYSPEQYQFNQGQQVTIYKVQDLEIALQKAMQNIAQLQKNLTFMIKYNEQLKQQHSTQQRKHSKTINQLQNLLTKKDKQILNLRQKHNQYQFQLSSIRQAFDQSKQTLQQKQQLIERYQKIINEQKTTISSLQDELLNNKYNQVSIQSNQSCFIQMEEMENKLEDLEYQNKRLLANLQKETKKYIQAEKENNLFKSWLGDIMGVKKVINGCQKILMNEIAKKINPNVHV